MQRRNFLSLAAVAPVAWLRPANPTKQKPLLEHRPGRWVVNYPSPEFASLQEAIDAAEPGGFVDIRNAAIVSQVIHLPYGKKLVLFPGASMIDCTVFCSKNGYVAQAPDYDARLRSGVHTGCAGLN
jgi:hypothetical protein